MCVCVCVKDFLCEKLRRNGSYLHMITFDHFNRWIMPFFFVNQDPEYHNHLTYVDVSSMLVKIYTDNVDHSFDFFGHILTIINDDSKLV